jgi:putative endonuclease
VSTRRETGKRGEAIAAAFLQRRGYGIIAANWRCSTGEIDLIASDGATLVFVEVRTRRSSVAGLAEESVTPRKQQRLIALADAYLQALDEAGTPWPGPWRIDVLALRLDADGAARVRHLQHAVEDAAA